MADIKQSPLHVFHEENGARFVPFAGWEMPVQYTSILEEHRAVRETAGLFDVSHMGEVRVVGCHAEKYLNYLATNDITKLSDGKSLYSMLCYENGSVVDDVIITRFNEKDFFLCINAGNTDKDINWMHKQAKSVNCDVKDETAQYALLALQGPKAEVILSMITEANLNSLKRFHVIRNNVGGVEVMISRTGYTGENGFELYCPTNAALPVARALHEAGNAHGLKLCGLGARDSLRLEAGLALYGHEISEEISPLEAGLGWTVKFSKPDDFIGRSALEKEKAGGSSRQLIFFQLNDRRIARGGTPVIFEDKKIGTVVSGTLSPMINKPIGSALITIDGVNPDKLYVDLRGHKINLERVNPPLHKQDRN
jgi:aminomethyltransferase